MKTVHIQWKSPNVLLMVRNCPKKKQFAPSGSEFFPLREVPILKRDAIEKNHCSFQVSPVDVRNFISVLATPFSVYHCLSVPRDVMGWSVI